MPSIPRNASCPCGSGLKSKRCCAGTVGAMESSRRREERVGRELGAWAIAHYGDELRQAGTPMREQLADHRDRDWILEQWAFLDAPLAGGMTAAERYADLSAHSAEDRAVLHALVGSRPGVFRVVGVVAGLRMRLLDLLGGGVIEVLSDEVSSHTALWDVIVARPLRHEGRATLWGPVSTHWAEEEPTILGEAHRLGGARALRDIWPLLMDIKATRPDAPIDVRCPEGRPAVVATAAWRLLDDDAAFDLLPEEFEYADLTEDNAEVLEWRVDLQAAAASRPPCDDRTAHLDADLLADAGESLDADDVLRYADTCVATLTVYADGLELEAPSEHRLDAAIVLVESALGGLAERTSRDVAPLPRTPMDRARLRLIGGRAVAAWLWTPRLSLDGLAPMAARDRSDLRPELERLVRVIENRAARRGEALDLWALLERPAEHRSAA